MRPLRDIEAWIEDWSPERAATAGAAGPAELLTAGEEVLEHWLTANGRAPTDARHEGFRLLALHRQAAKGDPSFNACRETCREAVYRYNLAQTDLGPEDWRRNLATLRRVVQHLLYFISGKMQDSAIGEFCCSSRPLRGSEAVPVMQGEDRR